MAEINKARLQATLVRDEGCNLERHEVQGVDHVGVGFNLETEWPDDLLDYLGVEDEDDIEVITQEQSDYILNYFVEKVAIPDCITVYSEDVWDGLSDLRREVLANLSFNLGINRLKAFRKMNVAVRNSNWAEASAQMLDSRAAKQTGGRYQRLAKVMELNNQQYFDLPDYKDSTVVSDSLDNNPLARYTNDELLGELRNRLLKNSAI